MLGLILLKFFAWTGHIGSFRSIVGEANESTTPFDGLVDIDLGG
jgi:hypothetical protein